MADRSVYTVSILSQYGGMTIEDLEGLPAQRLARKRLKYLHCFRKSVPSYSHPHNSHLKSICLLPSQK